MSRLPLFYFLSTLKSDLPIIVSFLNLESFQPTAKILRIVGDTLTQRIIPELLILKLPI